MINPEIIVKENGEYINVKSISNYESKARSMVAEFMILAGDIAADFAKKHNIPVPYRSQLKSNDIYGINNEESKIIQKKDMTNISDIVNLSWIQKVLKQLEPMSLLYPVRLTTTPSPHYGLALSSYLQVTSPIRRYSDLLVHYQIKAVLRGEEPPYNIDEMENKIFQLEEKQIEVNKLMNTSQRYWILRYLEREDRKRKYWGLVISIQQLLQYGTQSIVLLLELGFKFSLLLNRIPFRGEILQLQLASVDAFNNECSFD